MNLLETAIAFALDVHQGQLDRAGQPYILHPLHLMCQMDTEDERLVALLHDTIEDSDRTLAELQDAWPDIVIQPERRYLLDALFRKQESFFCLPYLYRGPLE